MMLRTRVILLALGCAVALVAAPLAQGQTRIAPKATNTKGAPANTSTTGTAKAADPAAQDPNRPGPDDATRLRMLRQMVGRSGGNQGGRGGPGGPGGFGGMRGLVGIYSLLLTSEDLQKEIKLSDQQKAALEAHQQKTRDSMRQMFQGGRGGQGGPGGGGQGGPGGGGQGGPGGGGQGGPGGGRGGRGQGGPTSFVPESGGLSGAGVVFVRLGDVEQLSITTTGSDGGDGVLFVQVAQGFPGGGQGPGQGQGGRGGRGQGGPGGGGPGGGFGPGGPGGGFGPGGAGMPDFQNMSNDERMAFFQQMAERAKQAMQQSEKEIEQILSPAQRKRLKEIELQIIGPLSILTDEEVQQYLKINELQLQQLQMIQQEMSQAEDKLNQERRAMFTRGGPGGGRGGNTPATGKAATKDTTKDDPAKAAQAQDDGAADRQARDDRMNQMRDMMTKMAGDQAKIEDAAIKKIKKVLNKNQSASFNKVIGKPFDIMKLAKNMGNGFGGPGGGRGQGGPGGGAPGGAPGGAAPGGGTAAPGAPGTAAPVPAPTVRGGANRS